MASRQASHSTLPPMNGVIDADRQKILVLGGRKAGKTGCIKMAFEGLRHQDAIYVDMTTKVTKLDFDSVVPLQILDTPGNFDILQLGAPEIGLNWSDISAVVYVVDILLPTISETLNSFGPLFVAAYAQNPKINFDVFLHKGDGFSQDNANEIFESLSRDATYYFEDFDLSAFFSPAANSSASPDKFAQEQEIAFIDGLQSQLRFHLTSLYDSSIFDAWSTVLRNMLEAQGLYPPLEGLMNSFVQTSGVDKAYLFDIHAKIYVAVDISSVDTHTFPLLSDYLKKKTALQALFVDVPAARKAHQLSHRPRTNGTFTPANGPYGEQMQQQTPTEEEEDEEEEEEEVDWPFQVARIGENSSIAYWEFTDKLALMCMIRSDVLRTRKGTIEYNVTWLKRGIMQVLDSVGA